MLYQLMFFDVYEIYRHLIRVFTTNNTATQHSTAAMNAYRTACLADVLCILSTALLSIDHCPLSITVKTDYPLMEFRWTCTCATFS